MLPGSARRETGGAIPQPAAAPEDNEDAYRRTQGRWKSRAELIHAEELEPQRCQPIHQGRLFKPRNAVKSRSNIVARRQHFASDGGISRFVGTDQTYVAEPVKEEDVTESPRGCDNDLVEIRVQVIKFIRKYVKIPWMRGGIKEVRIFARVLPVNFGIIPRKTARRQLGWRGSAFILRAVNGRRACAIFGWRFRKLRMSNAWKSCAGVSKILDVFSWNSVISQS